MRLRSRLFFLAFATAVPLGAFAPLAAGLVVRLAAEAPALPPAWGQPVEGDPAVRPIRAFYDALLEAMKQGGRLGIEGRYEKLAPVIRATFDLPAMTRIAVGSEWNSIAPELQRQLIETFSRMTIATYASRFDAYSGERFDVEPASEARNTGRIVRTKLIPSSGDTVSLNYLMRGSGDSWKVVDVYLTGAISELATRRSEFASILTAGGPPALVESLRRQADKEMSRRAKGDAGKR